MEKTIIEQIFIRNTVITAILFCGFLGVLILVRYTVKNEALPKWSYLVWLASLILFMTPLIIGLVNIHLDIKEEAYITYQGTYIERGGGQQDLKTVVVFDSDGKEVRLLRNGKSEKGQYVGTVVYGKRSKIIVEYTGSPVD